MIVYGATITPEQLRVLGNCMQFRPFTAKTLTQAALKRGVGFDVPGRTNEDVMYRVVDRLIQKYRKQGKIKSVKPFPAWRWVNKADV